MEKGIVKQEALMELINAIKETRRVFAPVRDSEGISLKELGTDDAVELNYANFKLSPKSLFFPQTELLSTVEEGKPCAVAGCTCDVFVFGLRPCDARTLLYLDKVFAADEADPYYVRKREHAVVAAMACAAPPPTCFCTSLGGSPAGQDGADILVFNLNGSLLFEACTDKGRALMDAHAEAFTEPTEAELQARDEQAAAAAAMMARIETSGITEKLQKTYDSPVWEAIAQRCLNCGTCAYICPTCHCFALFDEASGNRTRSWDSCQFAAFTSEASGHNPRKARGDRMRQRVMHKFNYTVENFGDIFCVGCGRCVSHCPANIDIRETITEAIG